MRLAPVVFLVALPGEGHGDAHGPVDGFVVLVAGHEREPLPGVDLEVDGATVDGAGRVVRAVAVFVVGLHRALEAGGLVAQRDVDAVGALGFQLGIADFVGQVADVRPAVV